MANHAIRFEYRRRGPDDAFEVVPAIDGTALTTLIDRFELAAGMHPAGGAYGGLVPSFFRHDSMNDLFHGTSDFGLGVDTPLLACDCGDVGCWPLMARITLAGDLVIWSHFRQPHRPTRDYSSFGPFMFDREQYDAAVDDLGVAVEAS